MAYVTQTMQENVKHKVAQHVFFVTKVQLVGIVYNKCMSNAQNMHNTKLVNVYLFI
jgi:hypothetical protein